MSARRSSSQAPHPERGAVLVLVAISMTVLLGFAALALDLGPEHRLDDVFVDQVDQSETVTHPGDDRHVIDPDHGCLILGSYSDSFFCRTGKMMWKWLPGQACSS